MNQREPLIRVRTLDWRVWVTLTTSPRHQLKIIFNLCFIYRNTYDYFTFAAFISSSDIVVVWFQYLYKVCFIQIVFVVQIYNLTWPWLMNLPARVCYIAVTFHTSIGLNTLVDGDTLLYDIHSVIYVYWCLTGWYTIYNIVPYTWYTRRYKPVSIWYHTYTISHGNYKIYTREPNRLRGNGPINSITNAVFRPFSFCFEMYCGFLIFKTWT